MNIEDLVAVELVEYALSNSDLIYTKCCEQLPKNPPDLKSFEAGNEVDLYLIIGGVSYALYTYQENTSHFQYAKLYRGLVNYLEKSSDFEDGGEILNDSLELVDRIAETNESIEEGIGTWVVLNLIEGDKSREELVENTILGNIAECIGEDIKENFGHWLLKSSEKDKNIKETILALVSSSSMIAELTLTKLTMELGGDPLFYYDNWKLDYDEWWRRVLTVGSAAFVLYNLESKIGNSDEYKRIVELVGYALESKFPGNGKESYLNIEDDIRELSDEMSISKIVGHVTVLNVKNDSELTNDERLLAYEIGESLENYILDPDTFYKWIQNE